MKNERKVLRNKSILLGITGGVSAYKSIDLIRRLREEGALVTVIMTEAAKHFVTPLSLEVASQNKVFSDLYADTMAHISLPAGADIMVVAPATANTIGKFAHGIADNLLSLSFLSFKGKVVMAPAMNWRMYENPVFRKNLDTLLNLGVIQVGPEKGSLACGEEGIGRMAEVPDIIEATKGALTINDLADENILVTAGPTREYLDPVRFLSNRSSGKMGYALARAALRRGAQVTLISGPSSLPQPKGVKFIPVDAAGDMHSAVNRELVSSTILIMSAAVSDFMPAEKSGEKIDKTGKLFLKLTATPDILSAVAKKKNRPFIVGFAAETGRKLEKARKKLKHKNMDLIVFNDVTEAGSGFDVETNKVVLIDKKKESELPLLNKDDVADAILDRIVELRA
ncbi:MAG: bifunctional phosphopantothenoylcysteine decarboxylase/phosphopantothenate--cysteine ligase CoaBC [Thermodesulfovibrionales bacterium]|nr:bifunctional phosphopantothenoylcysteine decarboxylase/phosphopantothenate--cysteine ligase CoaBC [Thermodesulfovibrionales bacterium]